MHGYMFCEEVSFFVPIIKSICTFILASCLVNGWVMWSFFWQRTKDKFHKIIFFRILIWFCKLLKNGFNFMCICDFSTLLRTNQIYVLLVINQFNHSRSQCAIFASSSGVASLFIPMVRWIVDTFLSLWVSMSTQTKKKLALDVFY